MTTMVPLPRAFRQANETEPGPSEGRGQLVWKVLAVVGPVATILLYWYISQSAVAPRTPWDENHLLQMARLISGDDNVAPLSGSGYYPGWAVIMAPIWWFTHDPATVYSAAVTLSNVIGVATIVPLAMLGRHLGLTWPQGVTAASIVMILPSRSVMADYALSEQAITFFYAWAVLAAFALWRRPTWWRTLLFVAAVGAAYVMHPRATALLGTAAIWMLAFALRRWRLAALGLALLVVVYVAVGRFVQAIGDRVLLDGFGKEAEVANTLANFDAPIFAKVFLNQTWVQVVGTAGLFAIGSILIVVWTVRDLRTRRLGTGAFLFGLLLSTMLISAIYWTNADVLTNLGYARLDAWTYSRYIDSASAIVVLVALAAIVRGLRPSVIATAAAVFAVGAVPVVFVIARYVPLWGAISPSNAAVLPWTRLFPDEPFDLPLVPTFTNEGRFWLWATVFVLACLAVLLVLRQRPRVLTTAGLALACALALLANPTQFRPYPAEVTAAIENIESLTVGADQATIDVNRTCAASGRARATAINWFPFWLSPREVDVVSPLEGQTFDADLVLSCNDWPEGRELGGRTYVGATDYGYRIWVLPGELQDELDADGLLDPVDASGAASGG